MKLDSLTDLLVLNLKDLYSGETQIYKKGLPAMIKVAEGELKKGFEDHLKQTKEHITRLEEIGKIMGTNFKGMKCVAMEGIIQEGAEIIKFKPTGNVNMAGLIGAGQKVENYEIGSYASAVILAKKIGLKDVVKLLTTTLIEEEATSKKLTRLAENNIESEK